MYVVNIELFVEPADAEDFERNFAASMHGTLPGVPGLRSAQLLRPETESTDRPYLMVMEFQDPAAYSAYLESDAFAAAHPWTDHAPIASAKLTSYHSLAEIS